jgi:hypothetical protein
MRLLLSFIAVLLSSSAYATVEVRGHYGMVFTNTDNFNKQLDSFSKDGPKMESPNPMGADLLYRTMKGWAVGLRYELLSQKKSGAGTISGTAVTTNTEFNGSRVSLLAGIPFISTPQHYAGALLHYALSQKLDYTSASTNAGGSTSTTSLSGTPAAGYGVGVEGGFQFGHFKIGAEGGYVAYKAEKFMQGEDERLDTSAKRIELDLSGPYVKVLAGVSY